MKKYKVSYEYPKCSKVIKNKYFNILKEARYFARKQNIATVYNTESYKILLDIQYGD